MQTFDEWWKKYAPGSWFTGAKEIARDAWFAGAASYTSYSSHPHCDKCNGPAMSMGGCMDEECPVNK